MAESAHEIYAQMVQASDEHRLRAQRERGDRWSPGAPRFREDPFRQNGTLRALQESLLPTDIVLDIGGGAGRYLPLALHCRQLINVEPSEGMGAEFEATVRESGITNASWLKSDWLSADISGDVAFVANVVYYVEDIVPFVEKLNDAVRRRVMIVMHSLSPVNVGAPVYRLIHGREQPLDPGYRELLPVLWEMGILPDVRVLGPSDFIVARTTYESEEAAIDALLPDSTAEAQRSSARRELSSHFSELFEPTPEGGFRRATSVPSRVLLVTWATDGHGA